MALNLNDRALQCLEPHHGHSFTARELAELIFKTYPAECEENRKSRKKVYKTDGEFIAQLAAEIGAHRKYLDERIRFEGSPMRYFFKDAGEGPSFTGSNQIASQGASGVATSEKKLTLDEFELYPVLFRFAKEKLSVRSMRVDEKRSSNTGGKNWNHWLHPDMVGLEVFEEGWEDIVREFVKKTNSPRVRIWSFEVKKWLGTSNFREAFFQTVSNSSWANLAYLVADSVDTEKILDDLQILSQVHGVGVIELGASDPTKKARILIAARERQSVDWDSVNRLAGANPCFCDFLDRIIKFFQTDAPDVVKWPEPSLDGSA
ncbi:MAG: hypothetical protein ACLQGT_15365 [Terracidiphilus sp.]